MQSGENGMVMEQKIRISSLPVLLIVSILIFLPEDALFAGTAKAQTPTSRPAATKLNWRQSPSSIALKSGEAVLWQFNYGSNLSKPFFHPISLAGIGTLTWQSPPDHPWHHALWFSWKYINGVNYWEEDRQSAQSKGRTTWRNVKVTPDPDHSAQITMDLVYHLPGEKPVLTEKRTIKISPPDESGAYHLDWTAVFTAGSDDVLLDRTPLPGEEGGKSFGGYAGLSVRLAKNFINFKAVSSDEHLEPEIDRIRTKAHAVDFSGTVSGKAAGIAILDHPSNLNAPSPWYIIMDTKKPMGYFSPAVIQNKPHLLAAGMTFTLRYRIIVHPGRFGPKILKRQYNVFARHRQR